MKSINLTLGNKIFLAFFLTIVLMVTAVSISIYCIQDIIQKSEEISKENNYRNVLLERRVDHLKWASSLKEFITDPTVNHLNIETNAHNCDLGKWYYGEERKIIEKEFPELKELFREMEKPHRELHQSAIEIREKYSGHNIEELLEIYHKKTELAINQVDNSFIKILQSYDKFIAINEAIIKSDRKRTLLLVVIFCSIAVLFSFTFALFTAKSIAKRINSFLIVTETISNGNLNVKIDQKDGKLKDEITNLNNALSKMLTNLQNVVLSVTKGADNIASASTQISSTSQVLSQRASEQASTSEEISANMEEISSNAEQNSSNASLSEKMTQVAKQNMTDIETKLHRLLNVNKEISDKITIVSDIAIQTNLLSLNASVEAARAGSYGSGFAVVASEVGRLASKSKLAASEIESITQQGLNLSQECKSALDKMLPDINNSTSKVQDISIASKEQSIGVNQVNEAVQQLNNLTQLTAASSEELAGNSEEMNSQAEELRQLISFFQLDSK